MTWTAGFYAVYIRLCRPQKPCHPRDGLCEGMGSMASEAVMQSVDLLYRLP